MEVLCDELRIEIFKYVDLPLSLLLTNRRWYVISQDYHTKACWLIYKYGRAHALFHAVRLENFISLNVVQALLGKGAIISRYFIQRLAMQFGIPDQQLIKMKLQYNVNYNINYNVVNSYQNQKPPWASELPLEIFSYLLSESLNALNKNELVLKGNDMELFHLLSAGPFTINFAPQVLYKNLKCIEDLILNKKFIPFPPRPFISTSSTTPIFPVSSAHSAPSPSITSFPYVPSPPPAPPSAPFTSFVPFTSSFNYLQRDGYEGIQQLNLIARAIIICPDLVKMWKQIGYDEICIHYNSLVLRGTLLILFPPVKPTNWAYPETDEVVKRLNQFIDLGFQLTNSVIKESIILFEHRIKEVQILINSFYIIRGESVMKTIINSPVIVTAINKKKTLE
jgi:hypothetical protein